MKRILMFVIAAVLFLPMSLLAARPGLVHDQRNAPVWDVESFTFRIDAEAFSQLTPETDSRIVLDFILAGGEDASVVGFADTNALHFSFWFGPNFSVDGDVFGSHSIDFLTNLNAIANNAANQTRLGYSDPSGRWLELHSLRIRQRPPRTFFKILQAAQN